MIHLKSDYSHPHIKAQVSFYGLTALFAAVAGVLFLTVFYKFKFVRLGFAIQNNLINQIMLLLLTGALFFIISFFIYFTVKQYLSFLRLNRKLSALRTTPPCELIRLLDRLGLLKHTVCINSDTPLVFTYGFSRPQIVVSSKLAAAFSMSEMEAVLLHEQYHLYHSDPLKVVISRAIKGSLFFLPLAKYLFRSYDQFKELAADQASLNKIPDKRYLASAFLKVFSDVENISVPVWLIEPNTTPDLRIAQLLSGNRQIRIAPPAHIAATFLFLAGILISFGQGCV